MKNFFFVLQQNVHTNFGTISIFLGRCAGASGQVWPAVAANPLQISFHTQLSGNFGLDFHTNQVVWSSFSSQFNSFSASNKKGAMLFFRKHSALCTLALALVGVWSANSSPSSGSSPSVIVFMIDDLGSSDVSFFSELMNNGTSTIPTPQIDALAREGSVFSRYYTEPLCGPSRAAFLTGRSGYTIGNAFPMEEGGWMAPAFNTIAGELRRIIYFCWFFCRCQKSGVKKKPLPFFHISRQTC